MPTWNLTNGADNFPTGGAGSPTFWTNTGDDIVNAFDGHDILDGGVGVDILRGGAGADSYFLDNAGDVVDETDGNANEIDRVFSSVAVDLSDASHFIGQIEMVQLLGSSNLDVTGNSVRNYLIGNAGANIIDGGAGADKMWGRGGGDTYIVDDIGDLVDELTYGLGAGNGTVLVRSSVSFDLTDPLQALGRIENVTLTGVANINAFGSDISNTLTGNAGANHLDGGYGGDTLIGMAGNDLYTVDHTRDFVDESVAGSRGIDTVQSWVPFNLGAQTAGAVENIILLGGSNWYAVGNSLANILIGNMGNNYIAGGNGNDTLTGDAGDDTFHFNTPLDAATNVDTITDMSNFRSNDSIQLWHVIFAELDPGTLPANAFRIGAAAVDADDRIIYNRPTGELIYDSNGNAAGGSTLFAILDNRPELTYNDFHVT